LLDQAIRALQVSAASGKLARAALAGSAMVFVPAAAILGAQAMTADRGAVTAASSLESGFGSEPIVIGAKSFTEQYILAELIAALTQPRLCEQHLYGRR